MERERERYFYAKIEVIIPCFYIHVFNAVLYCCLFQSFFSPFLSSDILIRKIGAGVKLSFHML